MTDKVTTMVLTVDLWCPCCCKKIREILAKFCEIQSQAYDLKKNTVTITVVCSDPEEFRDKLLCKFGKIIKSIEIKKPPEPKKEPEKPKQETNIVLIGCGICIGCSRGGPCSQRRCGTGSGCTCGGSCSQVRCGTCSGCCRGGRCSQGCQRPTGCGQCNEGNRGCQRPTGCGQQECCGQCNEEKPSGCTFM